MCVLYRTLYTLLIVNLYLSLLSLYFGVLFLCTNKTVFKVFQQRHSSLVDHSLPPVCGSIDTANVSQCHLRYLYATLIAQQHFVVYDAVLFKCYCVIVHV